MDRTLLRLYLVELVGTFGLVFVSAGVLCVQQMTIPPGLGAAVGPLVGQQPGLLGSALAQGLVYAVLLAATWPIAGGGLNPALTVMLWLCDRLETRRLAWLLGAQFLGGVLAGLCIKYLFAEHVLRDARYGTPHLSPLAYRTIGYDTIATGVGIELLLTFFLVFAMFGAILQRGGDAEPLREALAPWLLGAVAGGMLMVAVLVGQPLTGAALNPARWLGTAFWEWADYRPQGNAPHPFADLFVYFAGPLIGATLGGVVVFKLMAPPEDGKAPAAAPPPRGKG